MRDPAQGSDFTPDELDLLEDALEWVGDPARRADLEAMPAPLRQRADEYASILAMAREAMPEEDVAPGLLDGILAEARRAGAAAPPPVIEGPSLWERLRRSFLLPGVALAGTAALLLWMARPVDDAPSIHEEAAPSPAPAAPEAERQASAEAVKLEDMSQKAAGPEDSPAAEAPAQPVEAASAPGTAAEPLPAPEPLEPPKSLRGGAAKAKREVDEAVPLPGLDVPEAKRVDADKESVRDQLESGDRAREKGRCDLAEADYAAVARSNGPAAERARALAGLGLCRAAAGKDADAERYFDEARALDSGVARWLGGQLEPTSKKRSKAAAKPTADGL